MKTMSRKRFLQLVGTATSTAVLGSQNTAQAANFLTIAEDDSWLRPTGTPQLFGATGLARCTRRLGSEGLTSVRVIATPHSGPYVQAWMFGGHVQQATYQRATIQLTLDRIGIGYHFIELYLGQLYPYAFWDTTPVEVDAVVGSRRVRRYVERFATLNLPKASIRVLATYAGQPVSAFLLELPQARAIQEF